MTWEEYEALGEDPRAEYVDGRLHVSPSPTGQHRRIGRRLANLLEAALPRTAQVTTAWSWKPAADEFIPDVVVHPRTDETARFTGTPLLVVEILSSNRSDDLVLKMRKYAAVGLPRYWVVDPRDRRLDAFELASGAYRRTARIEDGGTARLYLGEGSVEVDLGALLRD